MKKRNKILPLVLMGLITLSGCNSSNGPVNPDINNNDKDDDKNHEHEWSNLYNFDRNKHWYYSTCSHDAKKDEAEHDYDENYVCKVCKYHHGRDLAEIDDCYYTIVDKEVEFQGMVDADNPNIVISNNITSIGKWWIINKPIESIIIPDSVTKLNEEAFSGKEFNCEVVLPDSIVSMEKKSFYDTILPSIKLPNNLKKIPDYCFADCSIKEIILPDSVEIIGDSAFTVDDMHFNKVKESNLESVILSKNLKTIGDNAFSSCKKLTNISLNNGLETIGGFAFSGTNIKDFLIPDSVTSIGSCCFANSAIENIELPSNIKEIKNGLFSDCQNIKELRIPEGVEIIGEDIFWYVKSNVTTYIPSTVKEIHSSLGYEIYYNGTLNDWLKVKTETKTNPFRYATIKHLKDNNGNFEDIANEQDIIIPDYITELTLDLLSTFFKQKNGTNDPDISHIKSLRIPKSVKKIYDRVLISRNIYYDGTLNDWLNIEMPKNGEIFYFSLQNRPEFNLFVKENDNFININELNIPTNIKTISERKFYGYHMNSKLVIPSNIEFIDRYAFSYIKDVEYLRLTNPLIKLEFYSFHGIDTLTTIEIDNPNGDFMDIQKNAFDTCDNLNTVIYNGTKESFMENSSLYKAIQLSCRKTVTVKFPDGETIPVSRYL